VLKVVLPLEAEVPKHRENGTADVDRCPHDRSKGCHAKRISETDVRHYNPQELGQHVGRGNDTNQPGPKRHFPNASPKRIGAQGQAH